jgi:hypothetical protein
MEPITDPIETIAGALLELPGEGVDHLEVLAALKQLVGAGLHHDTFRKLAEACDVCPIHVCDAAICADDNEPECSFLRVDLSYDPKRDPFLVGDELPNPLDTVDPAWGLPRGHHDHPLNVEYRALCAANPGPEPTPEED